MPELLNARPRPCLGGRSAQEVLDTALPLFRSLFTLERRKEARSWIDTCAEAIFGRMKASDRLQMQGVSMIARRVAWLGIVFVAGCAVAYVELYYLMVGRLIEGNAVSPVYFLLGDSPAAFFRPAHLLDCHLRPGYWRNADQAFGVRFYETPSSPGKLKDLDAP